jgi:excisionase family DNA binding protein
MVDLLANGPAAAGKGLKPLTVGVQTALHLTGIGRTKFYELLSDGTIESVTVGRRRLIRYASLERLAIGQQAGKTPPQIKDKCRPEAE